MSDETLTKFNPSGNPHVDWIKTHIQEVIEYIKGVHHSTDHYDTRCGQIAVTNLEQASMWAVKGLFAGKDD